MNTHQVVAGGRGHRPLASAPLVVELDASYEASEASGWAGRLAVDLKAPLIAVRTWQPWLGETRPQARAATERRLRAELRTWTLPACDAGIPPRLEIADGEPAEALERLARRKHAQMVVLGLNIASRSRRLEVGALAVHLTHSVPVAVAVVPLAGAARPVHRVLLGVHGSNSSVTACRWLADLGLQSRHVRVAAIFEPLIEWVPADDPASEWHELDRNLRGPWTAPLRSAGHAVTTEIHEGLNPMNRLTELAHEHHSDLIVVGAGERVRHQRSTPFGVRLASRAQLPVILVPALAGGT